MGIQEAIAKGAGRDHRHPRVYGEPLERDGVIIIPAAEIRAGGSAERFR